jgi:hypothetical protein
MSRFKPTSGLTSGGVKRAASKPSSITPETVGHETGLTAAGLRRVADLEVEAAPLTTQQRKNLPKSDFVFPDKAPGPGSYPIQDRKRGGNALSRSSGKPEEATVKRVVCRRYPTLPDCGGND